VTGRGTTVTRRTPAARVRDITPVFNVLPGQRGAGGGAGIADAPSATYLASMAGLAAVRLVLARSAAAYPPAPASFTQTGHVTADQLRDKDANPAAAVFAFLLNSGAAVGHLMTADVARFDPHDPAAMSADPAALPPSMREYHAWLLSNVCDPTVVHVAQEGYRRVMLQPTVAGDGSTRLPVCASCGLCTPSLKVEERSLRTLAVLAYTADDVAAFAAAPRLRREVASLLSVQGWRYHLHPEVVRVR